jgi:pimeloyl-ACP methyl ester carboxylesterase
MSRKGLTRHLLPHVLLIGGILTAGGLSGCASPPCGSGFPSPLADADWPERVTTGLDQLAASVPSVLPSGPDAETAPPVHVVRSETNGLGIVLQLDEPSPRPSSDARRETELVFVSFSPLARDGATPTRLPTTITIDDLHAGVYWHLYEPDNPPARGLVVHLGGNKYVRRALLERGWAVLDASGTGRNGRRRANPVSFEIEPGAKLDEAATRIAALFDDELADWPYSLEAVLQYLARHRPDLRQAPMACMGFSIGALALPAVVARMPDRFSAAVLVAGGANLLEISHRTDKPDSGIALNWVNTQPRSEDWQALYESYLAHAKLDPYHAAVALIGIPLLVYHGCFDRVVPASTGELLFTRLNEAQRHVYPVGHQHLLRIVMRLQAEQIARWMEAAISASPAVRDKSHR